MGDRSLMVAVPVSWNSPPLSIRQAKDIDTFSQDIYFPKLFVKILSTINLY